MITLSILIVLALICAFVGCLMGLFSLVGLLVSLVIGVLVGALAGYIAGRFMGTETSFARNAVLGVLGSFVGEFLFGMVGIHATGSFSSFVISILGACVCIWVDNKLFKRADLPELSALYICSPVWESFLFSPLDRYIDARYNAITIYRVSIQSEAI